MTYARTHKPVSKTPENTESLYSAPRVCGIRRILLRLTLWWAGVLQGHPVWPSPMQHFLSLEDRPGRIYVWTLHPSCSEKEAADLASAFHEEFIRKFNRPTRALHIVTPDVDVIHHLTREDVEAHVLPHLRREN